MADGIISALKQYVSERFNTLLMNMPIATLIGRN